MRKLKDVYHTNKLMLKQVKRNEKNALYSVHFNKNPNPIGYEVWKIRVAKPTTLFGRTYTEREIPPSNESFGSTAWSFCKFDVANVCFENMSR